MNDQLDIYQPYPKCKYHWKGTTTVQNVAEEAALEKGWADTPAAFEPYRGPRPPKTPDQDPGKWVDAWTVAGLSNEHRNRIKAQLLRADACFWRSPDGASADMDAMRQAFAGVAKVLAEAGIMTKELLKKEIPTLVWDAASAGGWYRFASEAPQDIFSGEARALLGMAGRGKKRTGRTCSTPKRGNGLPGCSRTQQKVKVIQTYPSGRHQRHRPQAKWSWRLAIPRRQQMTILASTSA